MQNAECGIFPKIKIDKLAIVLQNIRMWITRKYEKTLKALSEQFPSVVVTGARQVGKTALVQRVFPDYTYVTLDIPAIAAQAENHPEAFIH